MSLSNAEVLSIALGLVLGGFALIGLGIVAFFIYQHHRQRADISTALLSDEEEEAAARQPDDADPWEVNILPDVVTLLKSCKLLSYRLMSTVLEEAGQSDHELVTGSMDAIVAASRPIGARANDVTESMYHPVDRTRLLTSATALVKCIDDLVCATRYHHPLAALISTMTSRDLHE
ncbi:uncharacterized protein MONBRDRAFT_5433 [Monosiga brevicollis MX1]|uniref:Transmembrane protein 98 n=1 Tax=Monosiga brevicollis TaxID=81824 RepID=A9UQZ1_MONBE|nr:uncharacterized protein MONBRDRAFT_5433 [Monosiga brevicollis MX1]EDQ92683.1 predicted protein [Monosiga brevicollis MX1]|eukprot:XP_001742445.1 hypothetical protein [Monosiga brevicollis MX1]